MNLKEIFYKHEVILLWNYSQPAVWLASKSFFFNKLLDFITSGRRSSRDFFSFLFFFLNSRGQWMHCPDNLITASSCFLHNFLWQAQQKKKKKKKIHFPFHRCSNVKHPPSRHLRKDKIRILIFNKRFRPLTEMEEEEQEEEGEMPGTCWTFPPCGIIKMFYFSFFLGFLIEKNSQPASWLGHDPQSTAAAAAATAVLMLRDQSLVEAPWPAP